MSAYNMWMIVLFKIGISLEHAMYGCLHVFSDHTKGIPVSYSASDGRMSIYPPMATIGIVADSLAQRRSDNLTCCSH